MVSSRSSSSTMLSLAVVVGASLQGVQGLTTSTTTAATAATTTRTSTMRSAPLAMSSEDYSYLSQGQYLPEGSGEEEGPDPSGMAPHVESEVVSPSIVVPPNEATTTKGYAPYLNNGGYAPFLKGPAQRSNRPPIFTRQSGGQNGGLAPQAPNEAANSKGYSPYLTTANQPGAYHPFLSKPQHTADNSLKTPKRTSITPEGTIAPNEATNKKGYSPYLTTAASGDYHPFLVSKRDPNPAAATRGSIPHGTIRQNESGTTKGYSPYLTTAKTSGAYTPFTSKLSAGSDGRRESIPDGEIRQNETEQPDLSRFAMEGQAFSVDPPVKQTPVPEAAVEDTTMNDIDYSTENGFSSTAQ